MLTIHLVPPGKTDFSASGELLGINNPPLNRAGIEHADRVAGELQSLVLEAVFSGPLKRGFVTARRIALPHELPVRREAKLMDINFGSWSGMVWEQIEREDPKLMGKLRGSPRSFRFPHGDKLKRVWKRLQGFTRPLLLNFGTGHLVIVADDFLLMMLVSLISGRDLVELTPWKSSDGRMTVIECTREECRIVSLRGIAHGSSGAGRSVVQ